MFFTGCKIEKFNEQLIFCKKKNRCVERMRQNKTKTKQKTKKNQNALRCPLCRSVLVYIKAQSENIVTFVLEQSPTQ